MISIGGLGSAKVELGNQYIQKFCYVIFCNYKSANQDWQKGESHE